MGLPSSAGSRFIPGLRANVIRRRLQIVGAASTRSHPQRCLAPLPLGRRASRYFENEKLFPDALDRSNDQPLPTISNCARGRKWRVVCTTIRFRGSLLSGWSMPYSLDLGLLRPTLPSRFDPLESTVCFKNDVTADLTCWEPPTGCVRWPHHGRQERLMSIAQLTR